MRAWHLAEEMLALVLPRGFPESVGYQYEEYARWQFMGMAASAAAGVMSTQALVSTQKKHLSYNMATLEL